MTKTADPMTNTEIELDNELFEFLDFDSPEVQCQYGDCQTLATHNFICGLCGAGEPVCTPHAGELEKMIEQYPEYNISFDRSCKHNPEFQNCSVVPL